MDFLKIPIGYLVEEPITDNLRERYSNSPFTRRLPKGITPCDYDKDEKLIEVEYPDGDRRWFPLRLFFGIVIAEVKDIFLLYPDGKTEHLNIVGFEVFKVKRTKYWKLIFEKQLPF